MSSLFLSFSSLIFFMVEFPHEVSTIAEEMNSSNNMLLQYILDCTWSGFVEILGWTHNLILFLWNFIRNYTSSGHAAARDAAIGQRLTFDNGRQVQILRRIAEGGFSVIYLAKDCSPSALSTSSSSTRTTCNMGGKREFALKRMLCPDEETLNKIQQEKNIHRTFHHPNLLPLLGFILESHATTCGEYRGRVAYMLFPLLGPSLRDEISRRNLLSNDPSVTKYPFTSTEIIQLFAGVVDALREMHSKGFSHRDVKLENVLLDEDKKIQKRKGLNARPVLMDFGSAGPLCVPIKTRRQLMSATDDAATNCTMSYRAPELFEGGAMYGEEDIDVAKVDVWACGCFLFACMFGASPFECELRGEETIRIVDCSFLRVLGNVPKPLPGTKMASWYSPDLMDCVTWMLNQDRINRPTLDQVSVKVEELLKKLHGKRCWLEEDQYWDASNGSVNVGIMEIDSDAEERDLEALLPKS